MYKKTTNNSIMYSFYKHRQQTNVDLLSLWFF